jgi:DNA-binding beta-propeller fold protein YncE
MDPVELRIRNAMAPGSRMPTGQRVPMPAPVAELLERVRDMPMPVDESGLMPGGVSNATHGEGVRRGVGYAVAFKNVGFSEGIDDYSTARVRLSIEDGEPLVEVHTAAAEVGQGIVTVQAQIARTELGVERVAVLDADTGKMKRWWGAYGNKPDDTPLPPYNPANPPAQQFYNPVHCADMSVDRMIYVCDRVGDRLQVFTPDGKFVKEQWYEKNTLNAGSVWDIAFSKDAQQKYIFMADGVNEKVKIIDRQTLQELTTFGDGGRQPGEFYGVHSIAIDSKGNLYTTETYEGKRIQRFLYKGLAPVTKMNQGVLWPSRSTK